MAAGHVWGITWHNTHNPKYNTNDMSEESNYTPGPWSIRQEGVWSVGTDHEMTALVYGYTETEEQANAHLIAAAPDLLEAAKGIIQSIESGDGVVCYCALMAAIAKAEGRAN